MAASPGPGATAGVVHGEDFRMLLDEPDGRRRGGRAEDDVELAIPRHVHALLEPVELKLARPRLHREPGEFPHVDDLQAHRRDVIEVALPLVARPLFGVVVRANLHRSVSLSTAPRRCNHRATSQQSIAQTSPAVQPAKTSVG